MNTLSKIALLFVALVGLMNTINILIINKKIQLLETRSNNVSAIDKLTDDDLERAVEAIRAIQTYAFFYKDCTGKCLSKNNEQALQKIVDAVEQNNCEKGMEDMGFKRIEEQCPICGLFGDWMDDANPGQCSRCHRKVKMENDNAI